MLCYWSSVQNNGLKCLLCRVSVDGITCGVFLPLGVLGVLFRIIVPTMLFYSFSWGIIERGVCHLRTDVRKSGLWLRSKEDSIFQ